MDIVYAAEKPSIAVILSDYLNEHVRERDIVVRNNPDETGSFLIRWRFRRYMMSPAGEVVAERAIDYNSGA